MSKRKWRKHNFSSEERKAFMEQKVEELNLILEEGVKNFTYSPEEFKALLEMKALMPTYSFRNLLVAKKQLPGASHLASAKRWKELGRTMKKGETSIRIYAPRIGKEIKKESMDGSAIELEEEKIVGWIPVPVFDVSQTEGATLPIDKIDFRLKGESEEAKAIIDLVHEVSDCPITYTDTGSANGYYYINDHRIEVSDKIDVNQQAKTLVHEYVHSQVHGMESRTTAEEREVVAEGCAFVICSYFHLDTSRYSFHYVKGWSKDDSALLRFGSQIADISKDIIKCLDEVLISRQENGDQDQVTV